MKLLADRGGEKYNLCSELIAFIENRQGSYNTRTVRTSDCELICHQSVHRCSNFKQDYILTDTGKERRLLILLITLATTATSIIVVLIQNRRMSE